MFIVRMITVKPGKIHSTGLINKKSLPPALVSYMLIIKLATTLQIYNSHILLTQKKWATKINMYVCS